MYSQLHLKRHVLQEQKTYTLEVDKASIWGFWVQIFADASQSML
jgi:hypothetical protein